MDNLPLSSGADRNSNHIPKADTLFHLRYKLMQTITICAVTETRHIFEYECEHCSDALKVKTAEQPARLFRNHFTMVTNSLGAWENPLLGVKGWWDTKQNSVSFCWFTVKYLDSFKKISRCHSKSLHRGENLTFFVLHDPVVGLSGSIVRWHQRTDSFTLRLHRRLLLELISAWTAFQTMQALRN